MFVLVGIVIVIVAQIRMRAMAVDAIKTVLVPTVTGDMVTINFTVVVITTCSRRRSIRSRKSLKLVEQCAGDPDLSLTLDDAGHIASVLRKLMPLPADQSTDATLAACFSASCVF